MTRKRLSAVFLLVSIACFSFACRKQASLKGVELTIGFSDKKLTDNLITDVQYKWKTTSDFQKTSQDYCVYAHFWHKNNMLLQDDYYPDVPTSKWEPNKEYAFVRRIYIPSFIDEFDPEFKGEETLKVSVGLYSPYDRSGRTKFKILDKNLTIAPPPPDTPEIVYGDGWFEQEVNPNSGLKRWRWTTKEAKCLVDNPHRDALLVIKGGVNEDAIKDQKITIKINDIVLDEFVPAKNYFEKSYTVKKEMLGDKSEFDLIFSTDKTFIPAKIDSSSKDQRELGMQISFIYFR